MSTRRPEWTAEIARRVGDRISELRHEKGWSQRTLADRVGRTATQIGQWERGRFLPKLPALLELAATYDLGSIEELLGDTLGSRKLIELLPEVVDENQKQVGGTP